MTTEHSDDQKVVEAVRELASSVTSVFGRLREFGEYNSETENYQDSEAEPAITAFDQSLRWIQGDVNDLARSVEKGLPKNVTVGLLIRRIEDGVKGLHRLLSNLPARYCWTDRQNVEVFGDTGPIMVPSLLSIATGGIETACAELGALWQQRSANLAAAMQSAADRRPAGDRPGKVAPPR